MKDQMVALIPYATFAVVIVGGIALANFAGFSWWIGLLLGIAAVLINSLLLAWEDEQPGGFNNPKDPPISK